MVLRSTISRALLIGALTGGVATDWLARRDRRYALLLPAFGFAVTAPLLVAAWLAGRAARRWRC